VFNDVMKLNLANQFFWRPVLEQLRLRSEHGELLGDPTGVQPANRYCVGDSTVGANFAGGTTARRYRVHREVNNRANSAEPVAAPEALPQHESGSVSTISSVEPAFEARWDRARVDHVIERRGSV